MKRPAKKLVLRTDTIRPLTEGAIAGVQGGWTGITAACTSRVATQCCTVIVPPISSIIITG